MTAKEAVYNFRNGTVCYSKQGFPIGRKNSIHLHSTTNNNLERLCIGPRGLFSVFNSYQFRLVFFNLND